MIKTSIFAYVLSGHVFPEFKESDAMFAAERVRVTVTLSNAVRQTARCLVCHSCVSFQAPDWVDAEECHRCRVQFGVMTRKVHTASLWTSLGLWMRSFDLTVSGVQHHCRACGQIFCGKCSSKYSTIPKFGIEKEVRVCEPCFEQLNKWVSRCYATLIVFYSCNCISQ